MAIAPRVADPDVLRVMSYNVNFGVEGDPAGVAAIAEAHPDIVLLQETTAAWQATLTAAFPDAHARFVPPSGDWAASGIGVLSNVPILSVDVLTPETAGALFAAYRIVVEHHGKRIQLLDVHLRPPMSEGGSWVVGYFSTREIRERELAWHLAKLDPALPTIIAGDFNEEVDGLAIQYAVARGYTDAIAHFAGARRTWEWPLGSITLRFQLDHILVDERVEALDAGIVEAGRSDHKPIWADVAVL